MSAAALLVVAGLAAPSAAQEDAREAPWSAVEREARVRTWARDPAAHAAALAEALSAASGDWTCRAAACEALRRAAEVGVLVGERALAAELAPHLERLLGAGDDPALAQALELAAVWPAALSLTGGELERAAEHALPAVRLALVRCAERYPVAAARIAELALDPDARVALEAQRTWIASPALRAAVADLGPVARDADAGPGADAGADEGADGLSAEVLERACAPLAYLSAESPIGLALGVRLHGSPAVALALAHVWEHAGDPRERDLFLRAARAARARGLPLAQALEARLGEVLAEPERAWLLEGLLAAGEPGAVVARLAAGDARLAFELLVGREVAWDFEGTRRFVDPSEADRDLRARALATLASTRSAGPESAAEQLLARGLEDPDPALVEIAFRALGGSSDPLRWMDALHGAWQRQEPSARERLLRYLPRELAPAPFRAELFELAADEMRAPAARASALELLSAFRGDRELARAVDGWLADELARCATLAQGERRLSELRCTGLVRALASLEGEDAVPSLVAALAASAGGAAESSDISQVAAEALGETPAGRAALERWLAAEDGTAHGRGERARVEAAIVLAPFRSARAVEQLARSYAGADWELRTRVLKALQRLSDEASFDFLARVAADPVEERELRHLALAGLAFRGPESRVFATLRAVFEATEDPELRRAVLGFTGILGGPAARDFLCARLACVEALALEAKGDPAAERAGSEREALLVAFGRVALVDGRMPEALLEAWLRLPRASATRDLEARFAGETLATTSFRFGGELDLGELLASAGRAADALALAGEWWAFDARFLAALGERLAAGGDAEAARSVWHAALIGIAGEGDAPDRPELELRLRNSLIAAAEAAGEWDEAAGLTALVLADWRLLRTPAQAFAAVYGDFEPEGGSDPDRRLACAELHARARAALARGDLDEARAQALAAAAGLGFSAEARAAQERLERDLAEAGGAR